MAQNPQVNPQVKGGAIAYLTVDGAVKAAEFYQQAFAAEVVAMHPPDDKGRTMHVHLYVNGSSIMLTETLDPRRPRSRGVKSGRPR